MTIYVSSDFPNSEYPSRAVKDGRLLRLATGLYSDETSSEPETIVAQQWRTIVGKMLAGATVTGRCGFSGIPATHDSGAYLFVSHPRTRELKLPGLTVVPDASSIGPLPGDTPVAEGLHQASEQRALLDNLKPSRSARGRPSRTLSRSELHDQVVHLATTRTPEQQARLLSSVGELAELTRRPQEAEDIYVLFAAARGERPTVPSHSTSMRAAQTGSPIDKARVRMFATLAERLSTRSPLVRPVPTDKSRQRYLPFYEAYFSNFIEGTEFTVEEAAEIALEGVLPQDRPRDAHDILGTYRIVSDIAEMSLPLNSSDEYIEALRRRHASVMEGRPEMAPGEFKSKSNRAGTTIFVDPEMVEGTIRAGWSELETLNDPFARATYAMFMVNEIHPFADGNGRVARIMMNGELAQAGQSRVIIPTIMRGSYLSALSAMTNNQNHAALYSVLEYAQRWTLQIDFADIHRAYTTMNSTHAFVSSTDAEREGIHLLLANELRRFDSAGY